MAKTITRRSLLTTATLECIDRQTHEITESTYSTDGYMGAHDILDEATKNSVAFKSLPLRVVDVSYTVNTYSMSTEMWRAVAEVVDSTPISPEEAAVFGTRKSSKADSDTDTDND